LNEPRVSVIVPARNAASTLEECLESVCAQDLPDWEVVLVDNGSTDATAVLAATQAERDARVRVLRVDEPGVCGARNAGIAASRAGWLLFLDADDWLLPHALGAFLEAAHPDSALDAVHAGWSFVAPDGTVTDARFEGDSRRLFPVLARTCPFAIHACLVRREAVLRAGGFDPAFVTCEDWDLWQRVARTGAAFGSLPEVVSCYRVRPGSASFDARRLLADGLRVITTGHGPDPRVATPAPEHAGGRASGLLASARLAYTAWPAGLVLAAGGDARPLLAAVGDDRESGLDPDDVAQHLFTAASLPSRSASAWESVWERSGPDVERFVDALEAQAGAPGLAHGVLRILERKTLEAGSRPRTLGRTHGVRVDVADPIVGVAVPRRAERLNGAIVAEGRPLGTIELPVFGGLVPAYVLADAIAAELAWPILGLFFERGVYRELGLGRDGDGWAAWRGSLRLPLGEPGGGSGAPSGRAFHERVGWTVFLQELWGKADWEGDRFYDPGTPDPGPEERLVDSTPVVLELSGDLPRVESGASVVDVAVTVGGVAVDLIPVANPAGRLTPQSLRAAVDWSLGLELCRAAVREGILGRPLEGGSLRERLAAAAEARRAAADREEPAAPAASLTRDPGRAPHELVVPGGSAAAKLSRRTVAVIGRRSSAPPGSSGSRRAALPASASADLLETARRSGEPVIEPGRRGVSRWLPRAGARRTHVVYAPDLLWRSAPAAEAAPRSEPDDRRGGPAPREDDRGVAPGREPSGDSAHASAAADATGDREGRASPGDRQARREDRHRFEALFSAGADPWRYTSGYEQTKYSQTLELLPSGAIPRALELACAEGHFTVQLAPRVGSLTAADISARALERAAERCSGLANVDFRRLDVVEDPIEPGWDLIVCSEVLYYVPGRDALEGVAAKLASALRPGGHLLTAHARLAVDEPELPAFDWNVPFGVRGIADVLSAQPALRLVRELRTPLYRILLYRREDGHGGAERAGGPETLDAGHGALPREVAVQVRWPGAGPPRRDPPPGAPLLQLPILLYHRVAAGGSAAGAPYRVRPERFEEQLGYLREAGFYGVRLVDWAEAVRFRRPLPGRPVLFTFDDGYRDFADHAWPALRRHGFGATVFLVADEIGGVNRWDPAAGEELPLLDWPAIRALAAEGVEFGAHSCSHRSLRGLDPEAVTRESARARGVLERGLGRSVTAIAYPYGHEDAVVRHVAGGCGYVFGLSCRSGPARGGDPLLSLPRIEVAGSDGLWDFVAKLPP
jgi:peptidoglycan/xylan/chitin deacetylase (PgdA/CDA1 family)